MKKTEIIQLALVILGISIIVKALLALVEQVGTFATFSENISNDYYFLIIEAAILVIIFFIGFILITRSGILAKKISPEGKDSEVETKMEKADVMHVSIIILCLFFIIKLFTSFITAIYSVILAFFNDYVMFKDVLPDKVWTLIVYFAIVIVFMNSRKFSDWLLRKIM